MALDLGGNTVKSEINVTPLVDVVLVLLIIFMVITPLLQRGKAVELPAAQTLSELKSGGDPIFVSVTGDGHLWVEKSEVTLATLSHALAGEVTARPTAPLVLKADRSLDYKIIRNVLLEVAKTRVAGISLAAIQVESRENQ